MISNLLTQEKETTWILPKKERDKLANRILT